MHRDRDVRVSARARLGQAAARHGLGEQAQLGRFATNSDTPAAGQGYHAFRAEFFANTDSEDMIVKYKGPDTDGSWELVEGVHRTDFDYLNALSLTNLPDPRCPLHPC